MPTPRLDPTYKANAWLFGYCVPGQAYFGNALAYPQNAIFGQGAFAAQVAGLNIEDEYFKHVFGAPIARATGPWPVTPIMSMRGKGNWNKRVILYTRSGTQVIRQYTAVNAAPKECLVPTMLKLMEASFIWHLFDDATKRRLDHDASELGLRYYGYNYFTKLYIQNDERWLSYV